MLHRRTSRSLLAVAAAGLVLAACGDAGGALSTDDVRARAQLADAGPSAIYLDVTNDGDEDVELIAASVPGDVAGYTELHNTVPSEDGEGMDMSDDEMSDDEDMDMSDDEMSEGDMEDMDHGDMEGMGGMQMVQVQGIAVPAGETVSLEPGGLHIMLFELAEDLAEGDTFTATLEFDDDTTTEVEVEVTTTP